MEVLSQYEISCGPDLPYIVRLVCEAPALMNASSIRSRRKECVLGRNTVYFLAQARELTLNRRKIQPPPLHSDQGITSVDMNSREQRLAARLPEQSNIERNAGMRITRPPQPPARHLFSFSLQKYCAFAAALLPQSCLWPAFSGRSPLDRPGAPWAMLSIISPQAPDATVFLVTLPPRLVRPEHGQRLLPAATAGRTNTLSLKCSLPFPRAISTPGRRTAIINLLLAPFFTDWCQNRSLRCYDAEKPAPALF